ncbi:uncharacterized protein LOC134208139 [Armigeres subalbatus]|uniref:uncharacterized protein LOC134208139 n=1 Tax=Armigeres subalbatus TaxID=124917 RepID=UPI002ED360DB
MTPSSAMLNNRHESPSPCLSPRRDSNELECSPEIFTQFCTPSTVALISLVTAHPHCQPSSDDDDGNAYSLAGGTARSTDQSQRYHTILYTIYAKKRGTSSLTTCTKARKRRENRTI